MTEWAAGQAARLVEHDDRTRQPRPGGLVLAARVIQVTRSYVKADYGYSRAFPWGPATFWRGSGWRAWAGEFRWRLVPAADPGED